MSALLLRRRSNREANALLSALLVAFVLRLMPYILGYAGFYDAYPWLSFAPFGLTLVYGPLIYLYVVRLTSSRMPERWWLHFVPAAIQLTYYLAIFVQPLAFKNHFDATVVEPWIDPLETLLTFISLGAYLVAALRRYRDYLRWLDDATSAVAAHSLVWLRTFLMLFAASLVLDGSFEIVSRYVHRLNYFNRFGLYLWYAALVYYLALEGWRNADQTYPQRLDLASAPAAIPQTVAPAATAPTIDYRAEAQRWRDRTIAEGAFRDPELTLARLAERMGLSPAYVSRLVNDGLGQNFNEVINRMRVGSVMERLADPAESREILEIALDQGFSSKASFNRAFKAYAGMTPSAYRLRAAGHAAAEVQT